MKNKKTAFRRIPALFLAMALCITMQDVTAFAAKTRETGETPVFLSADTSQEQAETALENETIVITETERYDANYYADPALCFPVKQNTLYSQARAGLSLEEYVVAALENYETNIDVSAYNISKSWGSDEYLRILHHNPQLFYVQGQIGLTCQGDQVICYQPSYLAGKEEAMQMREELETAARRVLEQVDGSMDTVQKALVVHDYLALNCEYDQERLMAGNVPEISHTSYGSLVEGMAVCDGYANAYAYIMEQKLGIPCKIVSSESMNHAWNMIEIDGQWYHVDVTWDDPAWDRIGRVAHRTFLLSDQAISQQKHHSWTQGAAADSDRYDQEFWTGVQSAIYYYNGEWYYSIYENRAVALKKKADLFAANAETVYEASTWQSSEDRFYAASFMYLAKVNHILYFNTSTEILQLDAYGWIRVFYRPEDLEGKQIFGFAARDGEFLYAPNYLFGSDKQSDIRRFSEDAIPPQDLDAAFWAYVERNEQALQEYKDETIADINNTYISQLDRYYNKQWSEELKRLIDNVIDEIQRVQLGVYYEPVSGTMYIDGGLISYLNNIDLIFTRRTAQIEERMALYDWADLLDFAMDAKKELENYKNPKDYRAAQQKELEGAVEEGKTAIGKAKTKEDVTKELKAAKAKIDKIKTDAQLKGKEDKSALKAGMSFEKDQHTYKVLEDGSTVAFTKTKSRAKSISVPATITYGGIKYKVTEVSKNAFKNNKKVTTVKLGSNIATIGVSAFKGCKKLKTITISSKKLNTVGKQAFSGICAKAKVKVPAGKKKAYKQLLKGKGLSKKAKIV